MASGAPGAEPDECRGRGSADGPDDEGADGGGGKSGESRDPYPRLLGVRIQELKVQKAALKAERHNIVKDLRNAERRRGRLKRRARQLTNSDLLEVFELRKTEKAERGAQSAAKADKMGDPSSAAAGTVPEAPRPTETKGDASD
jgi:hypothetical protein